MSYVKGADRRQIQMLPECIEDLVGEDNPVRIIDLFVDNLDMEALGYAKAIPAETGRPAYDPRDLLKLYIYGYFNRIRSSRMLMKECKRNIELFFLLNRLSPDFRTIADFRKDNAEAIRQSFLEFTKQCLKMDLFKNDLMAIDGSKFRAVNGRKKMYNEEILEKKLARIDEHLAIYLKELEASDLEESGDDRSASGEQGKKADALRIKVKTLKDRRAIYKNYQSELRASDETQLLTTDPEARMMHTKDGFHCCYNVQTAVGSTSHLIAEYKVTNLVNDQKILCDFAKDVKEALSAPVLEIIADKGYDSKNEIKKCIMTGIVPYVGFRDDKGERIYARDYIHSNINTKMEHSKNADDISACLHAGILPACYENTNLSVEVHEEGSIGCFERREDRMSVVCPMGFTLVKRRNKRQGIEYASYAACRKCTNRCTPSNQPKRVYFGPNTDRVAAVMYGDRKPANAMPAGFTPHNAFFQKERIKKTILIRVKDDIPKQKQRLCISEHPFGTVKWHHGAHYLLCKGIRKATAEMGLAFLAYNMKRAIKLVGIQRLMMELGD
jgi:transposase